MKEFNKEEYNLMCAKFLEWKEGFAHEADSYGYIQTVDGYMTPFINTDNLFSNLSEHNSSQYIHSISELKFHTDWNWIIEVVEKIQEILIKEDNEFCIEFYQGLPGKKVTYVSWGYRKETKGENSKETVVQAIWEFLVEKNGTTF